MTNRTLIAELSRGADKPWVVEVEIDYPNPNDYLEPNEASFTSPEAAKVFMDKQAREGRSTKLYLEQEDNA